MGRMDHSPPGDVNSNDIDKFEECQSSFDPKSHDKQRRDPVIGTCVPARAEYIKTHKKLRPTPHSLTSHPWPFSPYISTSFQIVVKPVSRDLAKEYTLFKWCRITVAYRYFTVILNSRLSLSLYLLLTPSLFHNDRQQYHLHRQHKLRRGRGRGFGSAPFGPFHGGKGVHSPPAACWDA